MKKYKCEIGRRNGKPYKLIYDKLGRQQACDFSCRNRWRWFLWIANDYQGDFATKSKALTVTKE